MAEQATQEMMDESGGDTTGTAGGSNNDTGAADQGNAGDGTNSKGSEGAAGQAGSGADGSGSDTAGTDGGENMSWPEDWRHRLAGGDEKELKRLERLNTPDQLYKSYRELEQKVSSGEYSKNPFPADGSPEQQQKWRDENGVPSDPSGYDVQLDSGIVIGEADKQVVDEFLNDSFAKNRSKEDVNDMLGWYFSKQNELQQEARQQDGIDERKCSEVLKKEWGQDTDRILSNMRNVMTTNMDPEVIDSLMEARLPDGTALGNHPDIVRYMADLARQANPMASLPPGVSGSQDGIDNRIAEIEKFMRTNRTEYFKDEKMQKEYGQLLEAREKLK